MLSKNRSSTGLASLRSKVGRSLGRVRTPSRTRWRPPQLELLEQRLCCPCRPCWMARR